MEGKRVVVGITGGIAAFKTATVVSQLSQRGFDVQVVMTEAATKFITPLTLQVLSGHRVMVEVFDEREPGEVAHINLADHTDLFVVAPATAHTIAKIALGLADDMLSTALLATRSPIMIAPAMNGHMYQNPIVREHIATLKERGVYVIPPTKGQLACGYHGPGRMVEPDEIVAQVESFFSNRALLKGKKVLVTAGPTIERMDPVRYFSSDSSGKMGFALATAAREAGAVVTLISGPVALSTPNGVHRVDVQSASEMFETVMHYLPHMDVVIKAAAVSDYRPKQIYGHKVKKRSKADWVIELEKTKDIAAEIGKKRKAKTFFVGFAAETEQLEAFAMSKLKAKGMDLIVANLVTLPGAGFGSDTNIVTIYDHEGEVLSLPKMSKQQVARRIVDVIGERLSG